MTDTVNLYERRRTSRSWWIAPPLARKSSSPKQASQRPSWRRVGRLGESAGLARTCLESPTLPMISTGPCRPSCRNISSRSRAAADRHDGVGDCRQADDRDAPLRSTDRRGDTRARVRDSPDHRKPCGARRRAAASSQRSIRSADNRPGIPGGHGCRHAGRLMCPYGVATPGLA